MGYRQAEHLLCPYWCVLGINQFSESSSLNYKSIRPGWLSLKSPPAVTATGPCWIAFICNQVRLPSPKLLLSTCLFLSCSHELILQRGAQFDMWYQSFKNMTQAGGNCNSCQPAKETRTTLSPGQRPSAEWGFKTVCLRLFLWASHLILERTMEQWPSYGAGVSGLFFSYYKTQHSRWQW
jgi:hypothetical protein